MKTTIIICAGIALVLYLLALDACDLKKAQDTCEVKHSHEECFYAINR